MKQAFDRASARYVYILVRTDLSPAQQTVQAIHAGMQAIGVHGGLKEDTRVSVLAVRTEEELDRWAFVCGQSGVPFEVFMEPDHDIGLSALATAPISAELGRCFKKLPCWQPPMNQELV